MEHRRCARFPLRTRWSLTRLWFIEQRSNTIKVIHSRDEAGWAKSRKHVQDICDTDWQAVSTTTRELHKDPTVTSESCCLLGQDLAHKGLVVDVAVATSR